MAQLNSVILLPIHQFVIEIVSLHVKKLFQPKKNTNSHLVIFHDFFPHFCLLLIVILGFIIHQFSGIYEQRYILLVCFSSGTGTCCHEVSIIFRPKGFGFIFPHITRPQKLDRKTG